MAKYIVLMQQAHWNGATRRAAPSIPRQRWRAIKQGRLNGQCSDTIVEGVDFMAIPRVKCFMCLLVPMMATCINCMVIMAALHQDFSQMGQSIHHQLWGTLTVMLHWKCCSTTGEEMINMDGEEEIPSGAWRSQSRRSQILFMLIMNHRLQLKK